MLPAARRLTDASSFGETTRRGRRCRSRTLVVHAAPVVGDDPGARRVGRIGFVVSRAVGNAVVRNRVRRRLRHLCREHLDQLRDHDVVVRALPASARTGYQGLGADLARCLGEVVGPVTAS